MMARPKKVVATEASDTQNIDLIMGDYVVGTPTLEEIPAEVVGDAPTISEQTRLEMEEGRRVLADKSSTPDE
jgi:hypothetical protein